LWPTRRLYVDNLKVILISATPVCWMFWSYTSVREVTLTPAVEIVMLVAATPFALFVIPVLFLAAGC
jgi:hypothetical protein